MYLKNKIIHFLVFASLYMNIEVCARVFGKDLVGFRGITQYSLMGYTSIYMGILGGFLALLIAFLCDNDKYFKLKVWQKLLIGGSLITFVELVSGIILNLWLKLNIWNYTGKFTFLGQIELKNCLLWTFIITPLIIWLDSHLTYYIYKEDRPISLISIYQKLFRLQ